MKVRRTALMVAWLGLALAGCHSATAPASAVQQGKVITGPRDLGPVPDGAFMTDTTGYLAFRIADSGTLQRFRFTVITRFANRGTTSLFLGRCFPSSPQPLFNVWSADSTMVSGYEYAWACTGVDKLHEVRPGAVRVDTLVVEGPNMFRGTSALGETEGRFQLFFDVRLADGERAARAPRAACLSNAFIVRTAD